MAAPVQPSSARRAIKDVCFKPLSSELYTLQTERGQARITFRSFYHGPRLFFGPFRPKATISPGNHSTSFLQRRLPALQC
mmetsp:Transcript_468/g.928  ORF Transcript_468/g.928 Transcript_468/m.928 type:complete len:80 (-) Transcript_468:1612-1851(-)